jgi:hypothetical protein
MDNLSQTKPDMDNFLLDEQSVNSFQSLIIFNDNLRKHIKLSLSIYKKLNNFEHNYIHTLLNDKSKSNTK